MNPPILPMLAKRVDELPGGRNWIFEPKWDGFRALVFRDGDEILIQSRDEKPLNRYFPELLEPLRGAVAGALRARWRNRHRQEWRARFRGAAAPHSSGRVAGEASVPSKSRLPSCSSTCFARATAICGANRSKARRQELESLLSSAAPPIHLTPATRDSSVASDWFRRFEGAGLDGVMAKPISGTYEPDKRVMLKVKHERDCDCVVAGFRWHKKGERTAVGSLLLGLFDDSGALQHVGVCASFTHEKRRELVEFLAPYRQDALADHPWKHWAEHGPEAGEAGHRMPGGQSRWSQGKDLSWEPLRPELVVEVAYEHMQGARFRHMAQFRRWRTDKKPGDCTYAQLEVVPPQELTAIFAAGR